MKTKSYPFKIKISFGAQWRYKLVRIKI